MRLAWFTPLAPVRSGIAIYSAMVLPHLAATHDIDVFVDGDVWSSGGPEQTTAKRGDDGHLAIAWAGCRIRPAHDFVPRHRIRPADLIVYQLGNAQCHDYQWPYLLRYPGLVVLHDAQVHQSRAAALLRRDRKEDYRAEFGFCHPHAPAAVAEWVISGLGNAAAGLYPLTALVIDTARAVVVHHPRLAASLRDEHPSVSITAVRHGAPDLLAAGESPTGLKPCDTGVPAPPGPSPVARSSSSVDAGLVTFAAFGLITPEKRIPQILRALASIRAVAPAARLRLVGAAAPHYDVRADVSDLGIDDIVEITGFVGDAEFDRHIGEADVGLCLRWPTNREASGPWYRCLSAGKPTIVNDLVHAVEVPTLDPRTWSVLAASETAAAVAAPPGPDDAVAVSLDILDEDHSLALAMRRLALDRDLRLSLGLAARRFWSEGHTLAHMAADYERALAEAAATPARAAPAGLPAHARADGTDALRRLAAGLGVAVDLLG